MDKIFPKILTWDRETEQSVLKDFTAYKGYLLCAQCGETDINKLYNHSASPKGFGPFTVFCLNLKENSRSKLSCFDKFFVYLCGQKVNYVPHAFIHCAECGEKDVEKIKKCTVNPKDIGGTIYVCKFPKLCWSKYYKTNINVRALHME